MQEKRNKYVYWLISRRQKEGMEGEEGREEETQIKRTDPKCQDL